MTSSVLSRVAGLGVLTAAGQLLIVGSLPAYSNVFDPGTYGEYVIFVGCYTVLSVLAGVRYDSAIVLPRSDGVAASLSALVMLDRAGGSAADRGGDAAGRRRRGGCRRVGSGRCEFRLRLGGGNLGRARCSAA